MERIEAATRVRHVIETEASQDDSKVSAYSGETLMTLSRIQAEIATVVPENLRDVVISPNSYVLSSEGRDGHDTTINHITAINEALASLNSPTLSQQDLSRIIRPPSNRANDWIYGYVEDETVLDGWVEQQMRESKLSDEQRVAVPELIRYYNKWKFQTHNGRDEMPTQ